MINIRQLNDRLVEQDIEVRAGLTQRASTIEQPDIRVLAEIIADGLAAIHERQGNAIIKALQAP